MLIGGSQGSFGLNESYKLVLKLQEINENKPLSRLKIGPLENTLKFYQPLKN